MHELGLDTLVHELSSRASGDDDNDGEVPAEDEQSLP